MNKMRLIWGIVCLVLAAVLATLYFTLPSDRLMFMLGDENVPWVPAIIFAIVGIVLLATANLGARGQPAAPPKPEIVVDPEKAALNKQLESAAWGLFLIMLGGFMFIPETVITKGIWSIGVGLIMLGLNAVRYMKKLRMSGFTTVLGIISVFGGVLQMVGLEDAGGAILLIVLGAYLLLKPRIEERQLFGKAEQA